MKSQHTPGPWKVSQLSPLNICKQNGTLIADCCSGWQSFDGEREANTALIAAAPDLLAALEAIVKMIGPYQGQGRMDAEIDAARAAIAKARGEQ